MQKKCVELKVNEEGLAPQFVLVSLLNRFDNRYQAAADAFFKECTSKQMYFMFAVALFVEAPTIQDIADQMGSSNQNANKLYAKLLKEGYVTSQRDENDHRKQRIYLTQKAKDFLEENQIGNAQAVTDLFSVVTPREMKTMIDVMRRLTNRLEERSKKENKG